MLKSLELDYYTEGYKGIQMNCVELPIAAASGFHRYDNYFYYCFYASLLLNWRNSGDCHWIRDRDNIMTKFGLTFRANEAADESSLISIIRAKIDSQAPVVMIVNYHTLFYLETYLSDNKFSHGLIVSEYDASRNVVVIRERLIGNKVTRDFMKGDPFFKLQLTEEQLVDIWRKSNVFFANTKDLFHNKLFSIEHTHEPAINHGIDLIQDFLANYSLNDSWLAHNLLRNEEQLTGKLKDVNYAMFFRRDYHGSMEIFFDVLQKAFLDSGLSEGNRKRLTCFKEDYIRFREVIVSAVYARALRSQPWTRQDKEDMIHNIQSRDKELSDLVRELHDCC